jgi:hypothetical protein
MYSGDQVFYAVAVSVEQAYEILLAYAKKHNIVLNNTVEVYGDEYYIDELSSYNRIHDQFYVLQGMMSQLKVKHIDVLRPQCCNFSKYNSSIYIGANLGKNDVAYRDIVEEYEDFEEYYNSYIKYVLMMKTKIESQKLLIEAEIKDIGIDDCKPKIYTMANDCQNCT